MADINGGGLSFVSQMDNSQLDAAIEETLRRVQGLSDGMVGVGDSVDQAVAQIATTLGQIGAECEKHEVAIESLENEYKSLGVAAQKAFLNGATDQSQEIQSIRERQQAITGEIAVRKKLLTELRNQSNELENARGSLEQEAKAAANNEAAHVSLRQRMRELKMELVELEAAGQRGTERYREVQTEVARLTDAWGDAQTQASILANDDAGFAGVLNGLTGLTGAFSAAAGMVGLFGEQNKDLQETMLKIQSIMAITNGLMQVSQTLNKDSAFMLSTVGGLKEWWNNLLVVGAGAQEADNAAITTNTAAQAENATATTASSAATTTNTAANEANATARGQVATATGAATTAQGANTTATVAQTGAATAGTAANIGLAGAFRMVGAAIKSIPVFGWIIAGISALIALYATFTSKTKEAKKAQEDFSKSLVENCYKPIGKIEELSAAWTALGDNIKEKEAFIRKNKAAFDEFGLSIDGVTDAENVLVNNKEAFINAQIEKAKALAYIELGMNKLKEALQKRQDAENVSLNWIQRLFSYGGAGAKMINNKKNDLIRKAQGLESEVQEYFSKAHQAEVNGTNILNQAMITTNDVVAGSLGDLNNQIAQKRQELLKSLDAETYKKIMGEIQDLENQAAKITGATTTPRSSGSSKSNSDPFLEKLNKRKSEYQRFLKWVNSGDTVLVNSAKQEFAGLLEQGATYIDYLKNQRDQILSIDVAQRTKEQNKQLRQLNDAIAEETKNTVLDAFNQELSTQLGNAKSVIEMLNIIEQRRKELANDGTELDSGKAKILDDAEADATKQVAEQTKSLLDEYAGYVEQRKALEEQFNKDIELLTKARANATTQAEIDAIDAAIANRKRKYAEDTSGSGNADYDAMLAEYGTFEQRKQAIIDEYEKKRQIAQEQGNTEMVAALDKAQNEALSKFALEMLQASPDWSLMFGDLDEVATSKLEELIKKLNDLDGVYLGINFDPKDLETLKKKIQEIKGEIQERNPFKALISSISDYKKAADDAAKKKSLTALFNATASSIDLVKGSFDAVVSGLETMGFTADEETSQILGDLGNIMDGASQLASGIASANPLSIIQGSISIFSSVFDLFNSRDRKANKSIKKHQKEITELQNAYNQLSWAIDNALGTEVYKNEKAAIANMEQQQAHLKAMWEAEESKKKTDSDKVEEYKEQYAELARQIEDMYSDISQDILQTNATDFAGTLGDALVEAFKNGEDAATAFETTVNEVLQNAIVNQLKKKFLEQQLQGALDSLESQMGYWDGDDFIFTGLSDAQIASFKEKVQAAANNFNEALDVYKDLFEDLTDDSDDSLTGAVKGVSEETASIVAGQMNAIRINQIEMKDVLRQQLLVLNTIASNTSYNKHLAKIDQIITILESNDSLRGQGLV